MADILMILKNVDGKLKVHCPTCNRQLSDDAMDFPMYPCVCGALLFPDVQCLWEVNRQLQDSHERPN